jgi:hypothetical protein
LRRHESFGITLFCIVNCLLSIFKIAVNIKQGQYEVVYNLSRPTLFDNVPARCYNK